MNETEYDNRLKQIEEDYANAKKRLYVEYAASKRMFNIGDIISNNSTTILIERFSANKMFGMPEPIYIGRELRKDLKPKKSGDIASIYGNSNVELIVAAK